MNLQAFHIVGATVGQLLALVACIVALVYLWQRNVLKKKTFNQLSRRVPALDWLEKILMGCLWTGFVFLTMALVSGIYYFFNQAEYTAASIEKFVWASLVWLWYLATIVMRKVYSQPSRRIAHMSLVGFMLLGAAVFGLLFMIIR